MMTKHPNFFDSCLCVFRLWKFEISKTRLWQNIKSWRKCSIYFLAFTPETWWSWVQVLHQEQWQILVQKTLVRQSLLPTPDKQCKYSNHSKNGCICTLSGVSVTADSVEFVFAGQHLAVKKLWFLNDSRIWVFLIFSTLE